MSVSESNHEPTLFDNLPEQEGPGAASDAQVPTAESKPPSVSDDAAQEQSTPDAPTARATRAKKGGSKAAADNGNHAESAGDTGGEEGEGPTEAGSDGAEQEDSGVTDRKRLEQQLHALKRKEAELRCALLAATHPELADRIREIQGKAYTVSKAEEQLAQGLPKSEAKRQEKLDKKLAMLRSKRVELDEQIEAVSRELTELGTERMEKFESERTTAMEELMASLGAHGSTLEAAAVDPRELVPDLERWWPELEAIARRVSAN